MTPLLSKEILQQAQAWLLKSKDVMPVDVSVCLSMLIENMLKGEQSSQKAAKGFHELLVKFGFKPSSERMKKSTPQSDTPGLEVVKKLAKESKKLLLLHGDAKGKLGVDMQTGLSIECAERNTAEIKKLEDLDGIPDETERDEAQDADLGERLALGQDGSPGLEDPLENLFPSGPVIATTKDLDFTISNQDLTKAFGGSPTGLNKETISTTRQDFSLELCEVKVSYETAYCPRSGKSLTSAPESIGPKGFQITYRAMVNLTLLTVGFLVPMHRVSRLLGNSPLFHRSNIARYLGFAANKMLPVYLELAKQLSQAPYLWGDATPTRVNQVNRALEHRKDWTLCGPPKPYPWESSTLEDADEVQSTKTVPLWKQLQIELGYAFDKKTKKGFGQKTRHQTIVIHGKSDIKDPRSHIVFYRSCLGDVGNVLDYLLQFRNTKNKDLVLQCDHSSANLPSNPDVLKRINLTIAGCFAHARRPFKKYESQDPCVSEKLLPLMFMVTHLETQIKAAGKNQENTTSVRQSWTARYLETLYFILQQQIQKPNWSDQTPLGKAARHFIKHFKKLTVYLAHPELEATNNGSERALRAEKLSQGSSYFRDTIEGRTRFDILRTLYQTCTSAGIPFVHYLLYTLMLPNLDLKNQPEKFTPFAVKKLLESDSELKSKLDTILARGY